MRLQTKGVNYLAIERKKDKSKLLSSSKKGENFFCIELVL